MSEQKYKIAITQGDTNGIGWEVILKTLADGRMLELCTPIIYGSQKVANFYLKNLKDLEKINFNTISSASEARHGKVNIINCGDPKEAVNPGTESKDSGAAAVASLVAATADLKSGAVDAIVTAPINKESVQSEQFNFTGHTEYFAAEFQSSAMMIMCSDRLRVGLVTIHLPLSQVSSKITLDGVVESIHKLRATLKQDFGVVEPRIAVLSLNPHAGDGGLLGGEESQTIKPAIIKAFEKGVLAFGPFAADGFFATGGYAKYDAILAMYHDQGLAPFKTISPDGVNFSAGLSVVRTSPDHGVAYDIAGKDMADPQSMRNAIYMAIDLTQNRRNYKTWSRNPLQRAEREKSHRDLSVKDLKLPEQHHD